MFVNLCRVNGVVVLALKNGKKDFFLKIPWVIFMWVALVKLKVCTTIYNPS
jgi:hypothetical protein